MRAYLSRRYTLSASHRLFCSGKTDEENAAIFGKCANPFGHGHNYVVEVTLGGELDPVTGMVCDLAQLDTTVAREVLEPYDHVNLNLHADFSQLIPTTENFAFVIHRRLAASPLGHLLVEVRVEETGNNSFIYTANPLPLEARQWEKDKDQQG